MLYPSTDSLVGPTITVVTEVIAVDALLTDAVAEHVSRRLNPAAWDVIAEMRPATREEYAEALRSEARRAITTALPGTGVSE